MATARQLQIDFRSAVAAGVLTIYADQEQLLREAFSFHERKGLFRRRGTSGSLALATEIPPGTTSIRVFAAPKGSPAQHVSIQPPPGAVRPLRLNVELDADGSIRASFRN